MSYRIIIEHTRDARKILGKKWEKVGQVPKQHPTIADREYISDQMGYTPETDSVVTETVTIYEQTVDTLDLKAVISAVNP